MRIAILGAARIAAKALIEPAREHGGCTVKAVGASSLARAREYAAAHDIPVAGIYADVIARSDIDLVYIALPPSAHAEWAIAAASAGKHVFVEKPSATNAGEARAMVAAAETSGVRLIEAFHYAWHPLFLRAQELVHGGALGDITAISAEFSVPIQRSRDEFRWRADLGGGALADLGCYPVHWVRGLTEAEPTVVSAVQRMDTGVDVLTEAVLAVRHGPRCQIRTDMEPPERVIRLEITGTRASLAIDNPLAPQFGHRFLLTGADGSTREETFPRRPTFAYQFDGIVAALRSGASVRTEGADIIGNMRVMDVIRANHYTP